MGEEKGTRREKRWEDKRREEKRMEGRRDVVKEKSVESKVEWKGLKKMKEKKNK